MKAPNLHNSRETWLRAAASELRPYFAECGFKLPENIRYAIAGVVPFSVETPLTAIAR